MRKAGTPPQIVYAYAKTGLILLEDTPAPSHVRAEWNATTRYHPVAATSRDFVPWRFSDAARRRAWLGASCRRSRTCTSPDSLRSK